MGRGATTGTPRHGRDGWSSHRVPRSAEPRHPDIPPPPASGRPGLDVGDAGFRARGCVPVRPCLGGGWTGPVSSILQAPGGGRSHTSPFGGTKVGGSAPRLGGLSTWRGKGKGVPRGTGPPDTRPSQPRGEGGRGRGPRGVQARLTPIPRSLHDERAQALRDQRAQPVRHGPHGAPWPHLHPGTHRRRRAHRAR